MLFTDFYDTLYDSFFFCGECSDGSIIISFYSATNSTAFLFSIFFTGDFVGVAGFLADFEAAAGIFATLELDLPAALLVAGGFT